MFKGVIKTGLRFENDVKMDVKGKSWTDVNFYNALVEGKMEQVTVTFGEMKHTTFRMDTFKVEMRKVEINNVVIEARVLATMIEKSNINKITFSAGDSGVVLLADDIITYLKLKGKFEEVTLHNTTVVGFEVAEGTNIKKLVLVNSVIENSIVGENANIRHFNILESTITGGIDELGAIVREKKKP